MVERKLNGGGSQGRVVLRAVSRFMGALWLLRQGNVSSVPDVLVCGRSFDRVLRVGMLAACERGDR